MPISNRDYRLPCFAKGYAGLRWLLKQGFLQ